MVKFIIEVDEEYLNAKTDASKMASEVDDANDLMKAMMDLLVFTCISKKVEEGIKEFTVSNANMEGEKKTLFDNAFRAIAAIAQTEIAQKEKAEKDKAVE